MDGRIAGRVKQARKRAFKRKADIWAGEAGCMGLHRGRLEHHNHTHEEPVQEMSRVFDHEYPEEMPVVVQ